MLYKVLLLLGLHGSVQSNWTLSLALASRRILLILRPAVSIVHIAIGIDDLSFFLGYLRSTAGGTSLGASLGTNLRAISRDSRGDREFCKNDPVFTFTPFLFVLW